MTITKEQVNDIVYGYLAQIALLQAERDEFKTTNDNLQKELSGACKGLVDKEVLIADLRIAKERLEKELSTAMQEKGKAEGTATLLAEVVKGLKRDLDKAKKRSAKK